MGVSFVRDEVRAEFVSGGRDEDGYKVWLLK